LSGTIGRRGSSSGHRPSSRAAFYTSLRRRLDQRTAPDAALILGPTIGTPFLDHLCWRFAIKDVFPQWWSNFDADGYYCFVPRYVVWVECAGAFPLLLASLAGG
jgi:hypothetical protein